MPAYTHLKYDKGRLTERLALAGISMEETCALECRLDFLAVAKPLFNALGRDSHQKRSLMGFGFRPSLDGS